MYGYVYSREILDLHARVVHYLPKQHLYSHNTEGGGGVLL